MTIDTNVAPTNDAQAAAQEAARGDAPAPEGNVTVKIPENGGASTDAFEESPEERADKEAKAQAKKDERARNRTTAYIDRIRNDNQAMREELAALRRQSETAAQPKPDYAQAKDGEPRLADFGYDFEAYQRAHSQWTLDNYRKTAESSRQQADEAKRQHETVSSYQQKIDAFTEDHPDFVAVVSDMIVLPQAFQAAIMGHEQGPAIAYHLAQHEEEALDLAGKPAHLADRYIKQLASRLTATPEAPTKPTEPPKPAVSSAPAPTPTLTGRSATSKPAERMTDDEWLADQKAKKQGSRRGR